VHLGVGIILATVVGAGALVANDVTSITATAPSPPAVPLTRAAFTSVVTTGLSLDEPLIVRFSTPMDRDSVAASLRVRPAQDVDLAWDATGRTLTITPADAWRPDTLSSVVVDPGALAENGRPLVQPVRAAFLTRTATDGQIQASSPHGKRITTDTAFTITFSRPVTTASVAAGLRSEPVMDGTLVPTTWQPDGTTFTFTPRKRLPADTRYTLTMSGVRTIDGEVLAPVVMRAQTVSAPKVERFRPKKNATGVDRSAKISVRFSMPMDPATTKDAFSVKVNGKVAKGKVSFAEKGTVLVFKPRKPLPYRAKVTVTVGAGATSDIGTPIDKKATAKFRVERRPIPAGGGGSISIGSGGSGGGGSWAGVERYYLRLMNCTRTGGWVTSSGSCSSPGGRNVAPLQLDSGISSRVSRPYARLLATSGQCSHFADGGPDDRLRRAGYTNYTWGENIGCRGGNPYAAVLGSHLFFQSERPYNGGHYRNLMDPSFSRVGIGVWKSGSNVRLVIDFYHP
jgi:Bacterial Ig-like domain/Cysteine-rich secretory protein family